VVVVVRVFFVMGVRHGGDSTANQLIHPTSGNRNSRKFAKKVSNITHLSDTPTPLTGVCCRCYVPRGRHVRVQDRYLPSF